MIIEQLKKESLKGRGGAGFPTGLKWEMVRQAKGEKKYVICNVSEGEPAVTKDKFILDHYPEVAIEGIKIALETIDRSTAYIYLKKEYYKTYRHKLERLTRGLSVQILKKPTAI